MAKSEKSAQKSRRDKSLQKTKPEPTYKSAQFIEDSSSASEAPTPSRKKMSVGSTSGTVSTPSTKANLEDGSATKTEKHQKRKKSSDTRRVHLEGNRVEQEAEVQKVASNEKGKVNGLGSTPEDSDRSGEERSPQPESNKKILGGAKHSRSAIENGAPSIKTPNAEASPSGSPTSSDSEEEDVDVPTATAFGDKEDAVESNGEDDELEHQGGVTGVEGSRDAPSEGQDSEETSESESSRSSGVEKSVSKVPPAHTRRPVPVYQAPPDFEPAVISLGDVPNGEKFFSTAGLKEKELWHVILPSCVPVSALKDIPSQNILDGSKLLSHDESDYGLVPHGEAHARSLLIPSLADNLFTPVKTAFAKSLRLQQLIEVPSHAVNPKLGTPSSEVSRKKRNQQPEGLRMRYQPFGIPDSSGADPGTDFGVSEHHVDSKGHKMEASQFKPPPEPPSTRQREKKKKRKHGEIASSTPVTPSSSQLKKLKQDHPILDTTAPPTQSSALVSTPTSRSGNPHPITQAKPEDLITITNASPMQLKQEMLNAPANPTPSKKHRHKLQSSPPVTPAQPKHDVSSSSKKGTSNKSHHKAAKSEENHRSKLLQPFRVPRSVSPAQTPANGTSPNGATPTMADGIVAPHVDAPATDLGANSTKPDGFDNSNATAGASPHGLSQRPKKKKKKKTHTSSAENLPLPSCPESSTPLHGDVKVRDFVKASDLRVGEGANAATASNPFSNATTMEAPSVSIDGSKGNRKQASNSQGGSTHTAADTRIGEGAVDASLPTDVNTSKDVVMQDIDSKPTESALDDAAERERKKQKKKALKEARKRAMGGSKCDVIEHNGTGGVANKTASSPSLGVVKNVVVDEDSTVQKDSQPFDEMERARKKREKKERKEGRIVAEVKPVQQTSPEFFSVSATINDDTPSNGPGKTNSQLYEESERARKKREKNKTKEKNPAQAKSGITAADMSTSTPISAGKDPISTEYDAAPTTSQLYEETERARKKRERKERKARTNQITDAQQQPTHNPAPTLTSAGQDTTANEDNPAPTNSQLYHEGERARKKREEKGRLEASKQENNAARKTIGEGESTNHPAPAHNVAPPNERVPPQSKGPPANDSDLDVAAARAKRKAEKQARREERKSQKAMNAAAATTTTTITTNT